MVVGAIREGQELARRGERDRAIKVLADRAELSSAREICRRYRGAEKARAALKSASERGEIADSRRALAVWA